MKKYRTLLLDTLLAAFFCALFQVTATLLLYWHGGTNPPIQFFAVICLYSTVLTFIPLAIYNLIKAYRRSSKSAKKK